MDVIAPLSVFSNENLIEMVFNKNGKAMTTSRFIARYFDKRHDNVLKDIKELDCTAEFRLLNYEESSYLTFRRENSPSKISLR